MQHGDIRFVRIHFFPGRNCSIFEKIWKSSRCSLTYVWFCRNRHQHHSQSYYRYKSSVRLFPAQIAAHELVAWHVIVIPGMLIDIFSLVPVKLLLSARLYGPFSLVFIDSRLKNRGEVSRTTTPRNDLNLFEN